MFADLLGGRRRRRRPVDHRTSHRSVAADGGRLSGDRRRDHVDVEAPYNVDHGARRGQRPREGGRGW